MGNEIEFSGGCLCGAIRYRTTGIPLTTGHCHCQQCRRQSGALFFSGVGGFPAENISWLNKDPAIYEESLTRGWSFCPDCGSSIARLWLDEATTWLCIGTLDAPELVAPKYHMFTEEQIPWLDIDDELPRYPRYPTAWEVES